MNIFAGDVDQARQALAEAQSFAGQAPGALVQSQVAGLDLLLHLAEGDESYTADGLRGILELFPLGDGVSELLFNNVFAVPYVLVPASRAYWDRAPLSGIHAAVRSVAAAFARVRDSDDLSLITTMTWPEPGLIAAHMPVRWCAELALHGVRANRHEARRLAAWLVEHWQQPARAALQEFTDDTTLGDAARDVLTHTPTPPATSPALRLLGHTEVTFDEHHTSDPNWRRERVRALLCWLALNPDTNRDRAGGALWPDLSIERAAKNLRTTLNYLHVVLEPGRSPRDAAWFVRSDGQRITLHGSLDVDLWQFRELLDDADTAERAGHPHRALPLLLAAIRLWHGDLAADLDHEWLELERIHVRSRFVRAACRAGELLVAIRKPSEAIDAVRPALDADPYHERSYLALADAYRALDDHSSARAILRRAEETIGVPLD
jgi:DNA-binding SARP family transcriptional activator